MVAFCKVKPLNAGALDTFDFVNLMTRTVEKCPNDLVFGNRRVSDPELTPSAKRWLCPTQSRGTRFHDLSSYLHHGSACERQVSLARHGQRDVARNDGINQLRRLQPTTS